MLSGGKGQNAEAPSRSREALLPQDAEALLPQRGNGRELSRLACHGVPGSWFYREQNPAFARDAELAARAALFVVVAGLPFMIPQGTLPALDLIVDRSMYANSVVFFFVINLYKTCGETIRNVCYGLRGTVLAVCNAWLMYFLFPGLLLLITNTITVVTLTITVTVTITLTITIRFI